MSDNFGDTFNETGEWLTEEASKLVADAKREGRTTINLKRYLEMKARMEQWKRDFEKMAGEGEEWKNE